MRNAQLVLSRTSSPRLTTPPTHFTHPTSEPSPPLPEIPNSPRRPKAFQKPDAPAPRLSTLGQARASSSVLPAVPWPKHASYQSSQQRASRILRLCTAQLVQPRARRDERRKGRKEKNRHLECGSCECRMDEGEEYAGARMRVGEGVACLVWGLGVGVIGGGGGGVSMV
ncbi:hypothetical protein EJ04DRAFT_129490 [Polyplosphaeria fusca]|uniref:Uncharacterized protein n=1 Tax=Polyplosphaeria fusca TaxID=682080 RepID=A0A9P4R5H5_9PLEO|nr:hypothetical protein EJ04DRAFT_129490 [Polyplosphaeria fusca]